MGKAKIMMKIVKTKELLQKVAVNTTVAKHAMREAYQEKARAITIEKKVKVKRKQEKAAKLNKKNKWVRNLVLYAQKEKAAKKTGAVVAKKKLKKQKELGRKDVAKRKL